MISIIERALELASDGKHRTLDDIRRTLHSEHYEAIHASLAGQSIHDQLAARLKAARGGTTNSRTKLHLR